MLQKVSSPKSNRSGIMSTEMFNKLGPVILGQRLTNTSNEVRAQCNLIRKNRHGNCVNSTFSIRLAGSLFMRLSRVSELVKSSREREGSFEEIEGESCVDFCDLL